MFESTMWILVAIELKDIILLTQFCQVANPSRNRASEGVAVQKHCTLTKKNTKVYSQWWCGRLLGEESARNSLPRFTSWEMVVGIFPFSKFVAKSSTVKLRSWPILSGTAPVKLFRLRFSMAANDMVCKRMIQMKAMTRQQALCSIAYRDSLKCRYLQGLYRQTYYRLDPGRL
jgi:hypothetical protein